MTLENDAANTKKYKVLYYRHLVFLLLLRSLALPNFSYACGSLPRTKSKLKDYISEVLYASGRLLVHQGNF
ncbi:TPA: hypothetical protein U1269_001230 [Streptococcus suis]|nr:hypothetical protein [Streptococcus suis]